MILALSFTSRATSTMTDKCACDADFYRHKPQTSSNRMGSRQQLAKGEGGGGGGGVRGEQLPGSGGNLAPRPCANWTPKNKKETKN